MEQGGFVLRHFIFIAVIFVALLQSANVFVGPSEAVETTRIMVIVHSEAVDAGYAIDEIESRYKTSFGQKSVFHTEAQVHLVE